MANQRQRGEKPDKYYNFGVGWCSDDGNVVSCQVDWNRNKNSNNGQGYKLFLIPVDDSGDPIQGQEVEVTKFRLKPTDRTGAPDFQCYTWD